MSEVNINSLFMKNQIILKCWLLVIINIGLYHYTWAQSEILPFSLFGRGEGLKVKTYDGRVDSLFYHLELTFEMEGVEPIQVNNDTIQYFPNIIEGNIIFKYQAKRFDSKNLSTTVRNDSIVKTIRYESSKNTGLILFSRSESKIIYIASALEYNPYDNSNTARPLGFDYFSHSHFNNLSDSIVTQIILPPIWEFDKFFPITEHVFLELDGLPVALIKFTPLLPKIGEDIMFDASASFDPDGEIVSYKWDFDDGHVGEGIIVTHSYSKPGTYYILLEVQDNDGLKDLESQLITVSPEISGKINDVDARIGIGKLFKSPLTDATVNLYNSNDELLKFTIVEDGYFGFDGEGLNDKENYRLEVIKSEINSELSPFKFEMLVETAGITLNSGLIEIDFPFALKKQLHQRLEILREFQIEIDGLGIGPVKIDGYNLSTIDDLIQNWETINSNLDQTIAAMSRTALSLDILNSYFNESARLVDPSLRSILNTSLKIAELARLNKTIEDKIQELASIDNSSPLDQNNMILRFFREVSHIIYNNFKNNYKQAILSRIEDPKLKEIFEKIMLEIESLIFNDKKDFLKNFLKDRLVDVVVKEGAEILTEKYYLAKTQPKVRFIYNQATRDHHFGTQFKEAVTKAGDQLFFTNDANNLAINDAEELEGFSSDVEPITDLLEEVSVLAFSTGTLAVFAPLLYKASKIVDLLSSASSVGALVKYNSRYYKLPGELNSGIDYSFYSSRLNHYQKYSSGLYLRKSESLKSAIGLYNESLISVQQLLLDGNNDNFINFLSQLEMTNSKAEKEIVEVQNYIFAYSPYAHNIIDDFDSVYLDFISTLSNNNFQKLALQYSILAHILDPNNSGYANALVSEIDTLVSSNNQVVERLDYLMSFSSEIATPAFVVITDVSYPDSLSNLTEFEVILHYKNFGADRSGPFDIILEPNENLTLNKDSIRIESLNSEEEGFFNIKVNKVEEDALLQLSLVLQGVDGFSEVIFFTFDDALATITGIDEREIENFEISVFPNPTGGLIHLSLNTPFFRNFNVLLRDNLGRVIKTQFFEKSFEDRIYDFDISEFSAGVYILEIVDPSGNRSFKRIIKDN